MSSAPEPLSEDLLFAFGGLTKGLRDWARSRIGIEPGVTVGRAGMLLGLVERDEPISMSEFGTIHELTPRAMTVLVTGLEKEGLIERQPHPTDRRVTLLALTPTGRKIATEQLVPARGDTAALFNNLTIEDRAELLRLLGKVTALLHERGIETPTTPQRPQR